MNMISTGAFQTEMDASNRQQKVAEKFAAVWEKKNAKAARAGGVSLMALSLAACGSDDATTTTATATTTTTTTTTTTVVGGVFDLTPLNDIASSTQGLNGSVANDFRFTTADDTINGMTATMSANDVLLDGSTTDSDTINITATGGGTAITTLNVENVVLTASAGVVNLDASAMTGVTSVSVTGAVAATVDNVAAAATITSSDYTRILTIDDTNYDGTAALGTSDVLNVAVSGASYGSGATTRSGITLITDNASVIETLNVTSSGATANDFILDASTNVTLSTVNMLGSADLTMRVSHDDITGITIAGGDATGSTTLHLDRNGDGTTATNLANVSGMDTIVITDTAATPAAAMVLTSVTDGQSFKIIDDMAASSSIAVKSATASALASSITLDLHNTTGDLDIAGALSIQNVSTLNLASNGGLTGTAATGENGFTVDGDFTTINFTGDSTIDTTMNIDGAGTSGTTARTTTVDASGMTGVARLELDTDSSSLVTYVVTGTANGDTITASGTINGGAGADTIAGEAGADTIDAGAGADTVTITAGADSITLGAGNDTMDLNGTAPGTTAVQHIIISGDADATKTSVAAQDDYIVTVNGKSYKQDVLTNSDTGQDITTDFVTAFAATVLADSGVTVTQTTAGGTTGLTFTGATSGAQFTASAAFVDNGVSIDTGGGVTISGVLGTADVNFTVTDFAAGDKLDTVGLGALDTGYYEGAAASAATNGAFGIFVITDQAYANFGDAEAAVAGRIGADTDDTVMIFLNSTSGVAEAYFDTDIGADNNVAAADQLITFSNISNLTTLAATMSVDSFVI
jgi:hypothetical protein